MPKIRLAHWHGGQPPGTETDVDAETLAQLQRDGRVAEVLADKREADTEPETPEGQAADGGAEGGPADPGPEAESPSKPASRRKR